ncbi:Subtilisin-like protease 8, partial [Hondaea fermentalgiana]
MLLSKIVSVALVAATILGNAHGMIMSDQEAAAARDQGFGTTGRSLQDQEDYIAQVLDGADTGAACDFIAQNITQWKNEYIIDSLETNGSRDDQVTSATIKTCFVFFSGPQELATFVAGLEKVLSVELDVMVIGAAAPASWGLDRIDQENLPLNNAPLDISHTGIGVNIYILDTGVNVPHYEFGGRAHLMQDFTSEAGGSIVDGNGHGTHCSGTAAGATFGVAREATILGVKVLRSSGNGPTSGVIKGIKWAVQHQAEQYSGEAAVISMSLGGGRSTAMNNAVIEAAEAGMIVVVAAGNDNEDACNSSPASAGGNGAAGGVISVGSTTSSDRMSSFSNHGKCTDLFAPGSSIKSAWKGSSSAYKTKSGTSMATPHVAGVAAVLLDKHNKDKDAAQTELFSLLVPDKISSLEGEGTPNLLLQVPTYTGPPTPPTVSPTMPPTNLPNEVCIDGYCVPFEKSTFGRDFPLDEVISGPLFSTLNNLCAATDEDFRDKVVMVPRGDCTFFEKVKTAENQGAKAVIIRLTGATDAIFPANYYGSDSTELLSVMIGFKHATTVQNLIDYSDDGTEVLAVLGSPSNSGTQAPTPFPTTAAPTAPTHKPTMSPTSSPTNYPTVLCSSLDGRKSRCKSSDNCLWDSNTKECIDASGDLPCSLLTEEICANDATCAWLLLPEVSKNFACYDIDDVPTPVDDMQTPQACAAVKYDEAQALCEEMGLDLCLGSELAHATTQNECKFDSKWV